MSKDSTSEASAADLTPVTATAAAAPTTPPSPELIKTCEAQLRALPHSERMPNLAKICAEAQQLSSCKSAKNEAIFHFNKTGDPNAKVRQNILVFSLTHGDEIPSGSVALSWMNRLHDFPARNNWRVVPILNPDGWRAKTRTNANGVDVNRNFPSRDWDELAVKYWKNKAGSADRRFPGSTAGSEPETQCAMQHIDDFKPDFVISIHTPLATLDFDGPKVAFPKFRPLPWVSLGNFPGSLGRYLWVDRNVPVLTVELATNTIALKQLEEFDKLQDITGTVAQQAEKALKKKKTEEPPRSAAPRQNRKSQVSKNP